MMVQDYSEQKHGRIYLSAPHLDGAEQTYLRNALDSNWITTLGPEVDAFESEICAHLGLKAAVALSSGTAALHLAVLALGCVVVGGYLIRIGGGWRSVPEVEPAD